MAVSTDMVPPFSEQHADAIIRQTSRSYTSGHPCAYDQHVMRHELLSAKYSVSLFSLVYKSFSAIRASLSCISAISFWV
jgi:hypothetical protein